MFASTEDHCKEVTLEYHTRHVSSITVGEMMNSAHNSFHYVDMTGDVAFLFSEILSFIMCKSAKRVQNNIFFSNSAIKRYYGTTDRAKELAKKCSQHFFFENSLRHARKTADLRLIFLLNDVAN
jgi:hypothetical protein